MLPNPREGIVWVPYIYKESFERYNHIYKEYFGMVKTEDVRETGRDQKKV